MICSKTETMIYLDSSVALAYLLAEDRYPPKALWHQAIVSSRLLECEVWNRINARRLQDSHGDAVRGLIGRIAIIEMVPPVLRRAPSSRFPFPFPFARWMPFTWRPSSSSVPKEQACSFPATTNGWSGLHVGNCRVERKLNTSTTERDTKQVDDLGVSEAADIEFIDDNALAIDWISTPLAHARLRRYGTSRSLLFRWRRLFQPETAPSARSREASENYGCN
jgi:hypothetical protein